MGFSYGRRIHRLLPVDRRQSSFNVSLRHHRGLRSTILRLDHWFSPRSLSRTIDDETKDVVRDLSTELLLSAGDSLDQFQLRHAVQSNALHAWTDEIHCRGCSRSMWKCSVECLRTEESSSVDLGWRKDSSGRRISLHDRHREQSGVWLCYGEGLAAVSGRQCSYLSGCSKHRRLASVCESLLFGSSERFLLVEIGRWISSELHWQSREISFLPSLARGEKRSSSFSSLAELFQCVEWTFAGMSSLWSRSSQRSRRSSTTIDRSEQSFRRSLSLVALTLLDLLIGQKNGPMTDELVCFSSPWMCSSVGCSNDPCHVRSPSRSVRQGRRTNVEKTNWAFVVARANVSSAFELCRSATKECFRENGDRTVYVGNLPGEKFTDEELVHFFKPFGKISGKKKGRRETTTDERGI